jgi:hypothetical protein
VIQLSKGEEATKMSTCAYIIRNFEASDALKRDLVDFVKANHYGLFWSIHDPCTNKGLTFPGDFVFSVTDSFVYCSCDLILNRDDEPYAWAQPPMRLPERMKMVERIAQMLLQYTHAVELVFCDDNYTPDCLTRRTVSCGQVAEVLLQEYDDLCAPKYNEIWGEYVVNLIALPTLHLFIHK